MTSVADQPFLQVDQLRVRFGNGTAASDAVKGISFSVDRGETVALVGESGSGKSVSALSILQLLNYNMASHPSGSIFVNGEEVIGCDAIRLRRLRGGDVSMIFQEPMMSLNPLHTVAKQISESLRVHRGLSRRQAYDKALELLHRVRLPDPLHKMTAYPHELSGGQRQRVMIAMALANEPKLLIADEPTTALDVTIQANILELLQELQAETGMGLLLITHDLSIVRAMADRVCVMTHGEIVEAADCTTIFEHPQHEYTRKLLAAEPQGVPVPLADEAALLLEANDFSVRYKVGKGWLGRAGQFTAVHDLKLMVLQGQSIGVVGESGSGKTSLGLALLRLIESQGDERLLGHPLHDLKQKQLRPHRKHMQMVFQDPYGSLSPRMTVQQIVEEGLVVHFPQLSAVDRLQRVEDVLAHVGLDADAINRYPHEFSGGQRQRIAIGRAIALQPRFIVLDEPTSALDMSVQAQIVDLLRKLQTELKLSYLFISHDLKVVRALCHYVLVMKEGRVVEEGLAQDIFERPGNVYTQELMRAAFVR